MLIHDAVIEKVICGITTIHVKHLHNEVRNLEKKLQNTAETGYEHQYNVIIKK